MDDEEPDDELVGYKMPPSRTQFQPGQSGNPKGRPRKDRQAKGADIQSAIRGELAKYVTVQSGGRKRRVSRSDAVAAQIVQKALQGDPKSLAVLLRINGIGKYTQEREDILFDAFEHLAGSRDSDAKPVRVDKILQRAKAQGDPQFHARIQEGFDVRAAAADKALNKIAEAFHAVMQNRLAELDREEEKAEEAGHNNA